MSLFGAVLLGICILAMYTYFTRGKTKPVRQEEEQGISEEGRRDNERLAEIPNKGRKSSLKPALKRASGKRASDPPTPSVYSNEYLFRKGRHHVGFR